MNEEILKDLEQVFFKVFNKKIELLPETTAKDVEGWDSLRHMILVNEIEKRFKIKFSFKEVRSFNSVSDLIRTIHTKLTC